MKKIKTIGLILLIVITLVFINGCYFVFHGQFKATEKVESGKDLNAYEIFSTYTMHSACWLFGWIIEPTTAKLAFCSQFHITPKDSHLSVPINEQIEKIKLELTTGYLENNIPLNTKRRLAFKSYTDKASILLNGAYIQLSSIFKEDIAYTDSYFYQRYWEYTIPVDYKPGIVTIANIQISETLFDYLENKGILKPFNYSASHVDRLYK